MEQLLEENKRKAVINGLILTCVLFFGVAIGSVLFIAHPIITIAIGTRFIITRTIFWLILGIIYMYVIKKEKQPFLLWPEKALPSVLYYIISVIAILFITLLGSATLAISLKLMGLLKMSKIIPAVRGLSIPIKLLTIVTSGIVEELIFRGYVIPRLQLFFKSEHWPVVISAVAFGLLHMGYGTVVNVFVPVFIGLVFGYHYYKYRNLKVLIICHLLIDLNALFIPDIKH